MNRRDTVIALLAIGAAPLATEAQQPAKPARIGFLGFTSTDAAGHQIDAFKQRLRELGYVEGKNVEFEIHWALGNAERVPHLMKELVALKPDVILVGAPATVRAAQQATSTIPIVITNIGDPVGLGFVRSLSRPGGNITGLSTLAADLSPKQLELLLTVVPRRSSVAVLWNPNSAGTQLTNVQNAAQQVRVKLVTIEARTPVEIENGFAGIVREKIPGVVVLADATFLLQRRQIAELATKHRISSIFASREYADAGGLMSYGTNPSESFRDAASYVDRILKGAKPSDLPVEQSSKFELVLNLKTARAIGLTVPKSLLIRADRVIE